jgi:hypothetical protein
MISTLLERSVLRHPKAVLIGCASSVLFCWVQSMSYVRVSSSEFLEQTPTEHLFIQWRSLSPLAAYASSDSFAVLDLNVERHIIPALSAVNTRLTPRRELWQWRDMFTAYKSGGHRACMPEPELFLGAALADFDYAGISTRLVVHDMDTGAHMSRQTPLR